MWSQTIIWVCIHKKADWCKSYEGWINQTGDSNYFLKRLRGQKTWEEGRPLAEKIEGDSCSITGDFNSNPWYFLIKLFKHL